MYQLWQDLKYGVRMFRKNPGFTAVAVLTLALGIGANTVIFGFVNAVLLEPLPFPEPDRIVQPARQYQSATVPAISVPLFNYWKQHNQVFSHLAAYSFLPVGFNLAARGLPERVAGVRVSAEFFQVLGIDPMLGRTFAPDEDRPGGALVVILGYDLWRNRFGANPGLLGKTVSVDGEPYTVVGIMPPKFQFPVWAGFTGGTELWVPLQLPLQSRDPANSYAVLARLQPDVTRQQGAASLSILTQQLRKEFPRGASADQRAAAVSLHELLVGDVRPALVTLMVAVGLVLLIACANMANLMLSRTAARGREIAVRRALGAGPGRIFRQLSIESVLMAILGGAVALLVALGGQHVIVAFGPTNIPQIEQVGLDWQVLLFTLTVSVVTGMLFGLAPALNASKIDLHESLAESSLRTTAGGERRKLSAVLVVAETALSLMLLVGAALVLESFVKLANVNPGFNPRHVLTFETTLPESKYGTTAALSVFYGEALDRLRALPEVEAAANATTLPTELGPDLPFNIEGRPETNTNQAAGDSEYRAVSPDYFRAMQIPLLEGRLFTEADTVNSPAVVIINETMAHQFWPNQDPLGQTIVIGKAMGPEWIDRPRKVVGVAGDVKDISLNQATPPEMFVPYRQVPDYITAFDVREIPTRWVVRTKGDSHALVGPAGEAILATDANEPIASVKTLEELLSGSISRWRFNMLLLGSFAALALVLGAVGLYGVLSYSVAQRTHEIGIRMALGAKRGDILKMVVKQGMRLTFAGMGIGVICALALGRFLSSLLYAVKPIDLMIYVTVSLILTAVALLACYIPARRAMRVDPMVALRHE